MAEKIHLFAPKYYAKRMLLTSEELVQMDLHKKEGHCSPYYYEEMSEYFKQDKHTDGSKKKLNSEAGYDKDVQADWFYADFDKDGDPQGCALAILPLLQFLKKEEIYHIFFFSSSKGFHLYIPKGYIDYDPELDKQMNIVFKRFSKQLEKQFPGLSKVLDDQVYTRVHMLRMPFSYRFKSEMSKSLLSLAEDIDTTKHFTTWFIKEPYSKDLAVTIKEFLFNPQPVDKPYWKLDDIVKPDRPARILSTKKYDFPYKEKACIYKMVSDPKPAKGRHVTLLRLISFFHEKGYPEELIYSHIIHWNEGLENPLPEIEIAHDMKTIGKYSFTCNDSVKLSYCTLNNACSYWVDAEYSDNAPDSSSTLKKLRDYEGEDSTNHIQLDTLWEDFRVEVRPSAGHIVTWYAESGVGKTLIVMRAMLELNHIKWVFFSGEQAEQEIAGRFLKMLGLNLSDPNDREIYKSKTAHIFIEDGDIPVQDFPKVVRALEARENVKLGGSGFKIRGIGVDYLQNLAVRDISRPDSNRLIMGETERLVAASKILKQDAKRNKYCIFMISQIKLQLAEDGNTPLKKSDCKGSAAIINMSDSMIGLYRPHKDRAALVDDVFSLNCSKDRHGVGGFTHVYKWNPNRLLLSGEKHPGPIDYLPRKTWGG